MHECPECGKPTEGSWSEGGTKWSTCESCMNRNQDAIDQTLLHWLPAVDPERKKLVQRPKPEIHILQVCRGCGALTNAACSNWWSHKLEGMGVVTECYARIGRDGLRWVPGRGHPSDSTSVRHAEEHIARDTLNAPEELHNA